MAFVLKPEWFVLRTPLLPMDAWQDRESTTASIPSPGEGTGMPLRTLTGLLHRPDLQDAIFLASEELVVELRRALDAGTPLDEKLQSTLAAYVTRACSRPTPFGLFAGYSVGHIGPRTNLTIPPAHAWVRRTTLHGTTLAGILESLRRELLPHLSYRANPTLQRRGSHWHYVEEAGSGAERQHDYARIPCQDPVDCVIEAAQTAIHFGALVDLAARSAPEWFSNRDAASAFIVELILQQILVSTLKICTTGAPPLTALIRDLKGIPEARPHRRTLQRLRSRMAERDRAHLAWSPADYAEIKHIARSVTAAPVAFNVQLAKPCRDLALGENVVAAVDRTVQVLYRVAPDLRDPRLARFVEMFVERYGDAEVPLTEALDEHVGIGFGDRATESLGLAVPLEFPIRKPAKPMSWTVREEYLYDRLRSDDARGGVLELRDGDIEALSGGPKLPLPDALHVSVLLIASSCDAVDRGDFKVCVRHTAGPSGARLISRFAHGDRHLRRLIRQHLAAEEAAKSEVFAEIVHLPDEALADVFTRPVLRGFEIEFLGASGAPPERRILVEDLSVRVDGGTIRLRCPRLGLDVLPRHTSAHNFYQRRPSVYQFLCALQVQSCVQPLSWWWGGLETRDHLPRVAYRDGVLARARWRMAPSELARLRAVEDAPSRHQQVDAWRRSRGMPRHAALVRGDTELAVDFSDPLSADCLLRFSRAQRPHILVEQYPTSTQSCVTDGQSTYAHEILVVCTRAQTRDAPTRTTGTHARREWTPALDRPVRASYPPGSEWLYFKLYPRTLDRDAAVSYCASHIVQPAATAGLVDAWFFVRYSDPQPHVRLRLHAGEPARAASLVSEICRQLSGSVEDRRLSRFAVETYFPEINRYGGAQILPLAHAIFTADSIAACRVIDYLRPNAPRWLRFASVLVSVDRLFDDASVGLDERTALIAALRLQLRESVGDVELKRMLGRVFRVERPRLWPLLDGSDSTDMASGVLEVFRARTADLRPHMTALQRLVDKGCASRAMPDLLASFIHMSVNRLMPDPDLDYELLVYDLLHRFYAERSARSRLQSAMETGP